MFVIIRTEDGAFVTPSGSPHSYTTKLQHARIYRTRLEAEADRCALNEWVRPLGECLKADHDGGNR